MSERRNEDSSGALGSIKRLRTIRTFIKVGSCSETLCNVLDRAFEHPMTLEENASMPFAGGMLQHGYQCGMIWGATLAAGAEAFRRFGPGPEAEARALVAAQRLVESFRTNNRHINCLEITDLDESSTTRDHIVYFLLKGGSIGCFRMAAKYAPVALGEVNAALADEQTDIPSAPVSCAALLAHEAGAGDRHAAMAAGLAGGIGLSGGACGALGAAIWLVGMNTLRERGGKIDFKDPKALGLIDRFLKNNDFEMECSTIVGRTFRDVSDHAEFVSGGGCAGIVEMLAAECGNAGTVVPSDKAHQ